MTREDAQRSTDGQDVLNLATNLAGTCVDGMHT